MTNGVTQLLRQVSWEHRQRLRAVEERIRKARGSDNLAAKLADVETMMRRGHHVQMKDHFLVKVCLSALNAAWPLLYPTSNLQLFLPFTLPSKVKELEAAIREAGPHAGAHVHLREQVKMKLDEIDKARAACTMAYSTLTCEAGGWRTQCEHVCLCHRHSSRTRNV